MTASTNPTQDELTIVWKRINRQGIYYEKPMRFSEFKDFIEAHTQQAVREALLSILNDPVLDLNYYAHEGAPSENLSTQEGGEQIVATSVVEYIESKLQEDKQP